MAMDINVEDKRMRGIPKKSWINRIENNTKIVGVNNEEKKIRALW